MSGFLDEIIAWWPLILAIDLILSIACEAAAQWHFDIYHKSNSKKHLLIGSAFRISRVINTWVICVAMLKILTNSHF